MDSSTFLAFAQAQFPALTSLQAQRFSALEPLYRDWNAKINVISRKDIDHLYDHHVLHSLAIARFLQLQPLLLEAFSEGTVMDLGTGGGFPGIPLAILFPEAQFLLCDSVGKKTVVASAVASALGLDNVRVVQARAESLRESFGFVVSRAVAPLADLYPWVRGKFRHSLLCLKGGEVNEEIAAFQSRWRVPGGSISSYPVDAWLTDPWFAGKRVIGIAAGE